MNHVENDYTTDDTDFKSWIIYTSVIRKQCVNAPLLQRHIF